jgi:Rrf2 family nitric oxide-sensitive transcriptional repressor
MQHLARAGMVETRRGNGGGAVLARRPEEIRLGDLVALLEEDQALVECFGLGTMCTIDGRCRLKGRLRAAEAAFLADLNRSTLADIALPAPQPA